MKQIIPVAFLLLAANLVSAQRLPMFGAELGKKSVMGREVRVPYTSVSSYFGYVKAGAKPDEERGGKKYYYLYVWIPAVAPEIGVRMVSPAVGQPDASKDFVGPMWSEAEKDKSSYFDTWIEFSRSVDVFNVANAANAKTWTVLETNDDSGDLPAQPSGSKYNSLLRVTSNTSDPLKSLVRGIYRIGFTTYKTGEVQGSFLAQVAAPIELPGVIIASSLDELAKKAAAAGN